jgi:hypothetical protein
MGEKSAAKSKGPKSKSSGASTAKEGKSGQPSAAKAAAATSPSPVAKSSQAPVPTSPPAASAPRPSLASTPPVAASSSSTPPTPHVRGPRHLRAPIEIRVEITARNQSFTTTSRNIALGGISFESQQQFRVGDAINVLLYIPVRKELELLKVASEVVWVEDLGGSWMCGTAFRKFAPGDERRLREWLLESVRAQRAGLATGVAQAAAEPDDDDG